MTTRPTETTTERPRFEITDQRSAEWYVRRLRQIEEDAAAVRAATAQRLSELEADRARLASAYGSQLEAWARAEAERRRRRTITLPTAGAQITLRRVPARLEIGDTASAAEVAASLGFVKPAPVDLPAYRAHAVQVLEDTGELLPGCRMTEEAERVTVAPIRQAGEEAPQE
jgi:hypothetical protein